MSTTARHILLVTALFMGLSSGSCWAQDTQRIERGRSLVDGVAACGSCHTPKSSRGQDRMDRWLAGGQRMGVPGSAIFSANITPDLETGIGKWSETQIIRAIREGIRPDGRVIGFMPFAMYRQISDADAGAMVAYLRSLTPINNPVPPPEYVVGLPLNYGPPLAAVVAPSRDDLVKYGEYLAGPVGHCVLCHTRVGDGKLPHDPLPKDFAERIGSGGNRFQGPWGMAIGGNITPHETGLKTWTDAEIEKAIRKGIHPNGSRLNAPMRYVQYDTMSDGDMRAIIAYLRSLKPLPLGGE